MTNKHVLVVDDDPMISKIVTANLKARNFTVTTAENGLAALEAIAQEMPDLVILDMMMPLMDGTEVCRQVRETSRVPIIMLTANGQVSSKAELLLIGADDYVTKPFSVNELLARVNAVMRRSSRS